MARIRIAVGLIGSVLGALLSLFYLALNGYREDVGTPVFHTLWLAIPLALISGATAVLSVGALLSNAKREQWSSVALALVLLTTVALVLLAVINSR